MITDTFANHPSGSFTFKSDTVRLHLCEVLSESALISAEGITPKCWLLLLLFEQKMNQAAAGLSGYFQEEPSLNF